MQQSTADENTATPSNFEDFDAKTLRNVRALRTFRSVWHTDWHQKRLARLNELELY